MASFASAQLNAYSPPATGSYLDLRLFGNLVRFTAAAATDRATRQFSVSGAWSYELYSQINQYITDNGPELYTSSFEFVPAQPDAPGSEYDIIKVTATQEGYTYNFNDSQVTGQGWNLGTFNPAPEPLVVSYTSQLVACFGGSTGSIQVQVSGGATPYNYLWQDGVTTQNRELLPVGTYQLTVQDHSQQSKQLTVTIGQNPEISVVGSIDKDAISLEVTSGNGPFTFLWSDGNSEQNRTNLAVGSYDVTVTNSLGCSKTFTFTIAALQRFYFSHNPVLLELRARNLAAKPNLTFICEVYVEPEYLSGNFIRVAELEHPADKDGSTRFDVSVFLRPYLQAYFPEPGQNLVSPATGAFKRFYLRHTEKYGKPAVTENFAVVDYRYVLRGGLGFEEAPRELFFASELALRQPFFTWWPPVKKVTPDQPEYLFLMLHQEAVSGFQVKVKYTLANGISHVITPFTVANCLRFELYCLPVGFNLLNLAAVNPEIVTYEVWCTDQSGRVISETRTYQLESRYFRKRRYFLYINSLGGINTLACVGLAERTADVKTEIRERQLNAGYNPALGNTEITEVQASSVLSLSTGYLDQAEELEALTDFVLSREVRLLEAGRYRAGRVKARKLKPLDETDELKYLDFDFILPTEQFFTPTLYQRLS